MKKALLLSGIYWNDTYQRHQQFAKYLVKAGYEVVFVEHIISSKFTTQKLKKVLFRKLLNKTSKVNIKEDLSKHITLVNQGFINPMGGVFKLINIVKVKQLVNKIKKMGINKFDLVINYLPIYTTRYIISYFSYDNLIYDCVRDFINWGDSCKNIEYEEKWLVHKANYVFTDSYYLTEKQKKMHTYNIKQFLPVVDNMWILGCKNIKIPEKINKIGYFGSFDLHIDTEILEQLCEAGYEIHFWGKEGVNISSKIVNHGFYTNLALLATDIIAKVDAIIIPYKGNMDGVIPAKIMQALFTRLPVYISSFYDSKVLEKFLYVYETSEELLLHLHNYDKESHIYKQKETERFLSDKHEDDQYEKFKETID